MPDGALFTILLFAGLACMAAASLVVGATRALMAVACLLFVVGAVLALATVV